MPDTDNFMENTAKRLVIVIGMHRCGTSAITRGLQILGVNLGNKLMDGVEGENEKGFWEDLDFYEFNNEMLNSLESEWHYLTFISKKQCEELKNNGYFQRAVNLIKSKTNDYSVYGIKDPRMAKLLPFWKEVFDHCRIEASYIVAFRHPLSVAKSLEKRNGFDIEKSYFMWLGYIIASLTETIGCKRIVVDYDKLMQNPEVEIKRIAAYFNLPFNYSELDIYKTQFLDDNLRHSTYELKDLDQDKAAHKLLREVYCTVLDLSVAKQADDIFLSEITFEWLEEIARLNPALKLADKLCKQAETSINKLEECSKERDRLLQLLTEEEKLIREKEYFIQKEESLILAKENEMQEKNSFIKKQEDIIRRQEFRIGELENKLREKDAEIQKKDAHISEIENLIQQKEADNKAQDDARKLLMSSLSWKVTKPLRWMAGLFGNRSD